MMATPEKFKNPSNSTRFPDSIKAFVVWIMRQVKLVDKPATMMRECLQLGVQIRAAGLRPDEHGLYWEMSGPDLAREIEGYVRQAARFCQSQGYPILDVPPQLLEELEQTRQNQHRLDSRLARIEGLLTQLTLGGTMLNHASLLELTGNGAGGVLRLRYVGGTLSNPSRATTTLRTVSVLNQASLCSADVCMGASCW